MKKREDLTFELLTKLLVEEGKSYEEVGRLYGCTGINIKLIAQRRGVALVNRQPIYDSSNNKKRGTAKKRICENCGKTYNRPSGKFCSSKCSGECQRKQTIQKYHENNAEGKFLTSTAPWLKALVLSEQNHHCSICGVSDEDWNGKPIVFILDHIDGNAINHKRDNLRCVCPNCDSQLDTYKAKNKNGARHYYRYRYSGVKDDFKENKPL